MKDYSIIVKGKVRGVGYRRDVQQKAWEFDIVGSVKNLKDGSVQIQAQGEGRNLEKFEKSLGKVALPSKVSQVVESPAKVSSKRTIFEIVLGEPREEFEEGLNAGQEQLILLRKDFGRFSKITSTNFNTLAGRYDKISDALPVLTKQTEQFSNALTTITDLAKQYYNERRSERQKN